MSIYTGFSGSNSTFLNENTILAKENFCTNTLNFCSFAVLIYDHLITLEDEIQYIWKGPQSPLVWLFLVNRYLTPIAFSISLMSFIPSFWTNKGCRAFAYFEEIMIVIGILIVSLMMTIRIHAIYRQKTRWATSLLVVTMVIETVVNAFALSKIKPVANEAGCFLVFEPSTSFTPSVLAWIPFTYDNIALFLVLGRVLPHRWDGAPIGLFYSRNFSSPTMRWMFEDGLIYYLAMFAIHVFLTVVFIMTPNFPKNATSIIHTELLMMVAVMSRITIRIRRKTARERENIRVSSAGLGGNALVGPSSASRMVSQAFLPIQVQRLSSLPLADDNKILNQESVDKEERTMRPSRPSSHAMVKRSNSEQDAQRGSMVVELVLDIA